jgi:ABC-type nitrate/sulfonate/bicarbonate transport system permease component
MERDLKKWQKPLLWACGIVLALAVWKGLALWLGEFKLPALETILLAMLVDLTQNPILDMQGGGSNGIWPHLLYTFERTLLGSAIGVMLGVAFGLLIGYSRWLRLLLEAPIETMRTVPPLAAIPFFLMWFGPTQTAQLTMMPFYCFFMLLINTVSAIANVNPVYINYANTLGPAEDPDQLQIYGIAPQLYTSERMGLDHSLAPQQSNPVLLTLR